MVGVLICLKVELGCPSLLSPKHQAWLFVLDAF